MGNEGAAAAGGIMLLVFVVGLWILPMFFATNIWSKKGGEGFIGFIMGFFLGWIGVIIAAVATPSAAVASMASSPASPNLPTKPTFGGPGKQTRDCPHCKEPMRADASVCLRCQRESEPWEYRNDTWYLTRPSGTYFLDSSRNEWVREENAPVPPS